MGADLGCIRLMFKVLDIVWEVTQELKVAILPGGVQVAKLYSQKSDNTVSHLGTDLKLFLNNDRSGC